MAQNKIKKNTAVLALRDLDLGEDAALLYTRMLERPGSTVQELGTHTPYPRTMLYYLLKQLIERGLVSAKKERWRTVYIAEDPERLYDLLARKEKEIERQALKIRELIPRLKNQYRLAGKRPGIRMFEGVDEYRKALEDIIITEPKEIYAYEVLRMKKPGREIRDTHERRRVARKIKKQVLFFEEEGATAFLKQRGYDDFTQFRSIKNNSVAPFATDVTLYSGKVLYTNYYDPHEPTAVLVEDQALYDMQKNIFASLWKEGKDRTLAFIN